MGYPYGALYRVLILTGCRLQELAGARWSEIDGNLLTVPASRFKSDVEHLVPLTPAVTAILDGLPRWATSDFIFSSGGKKPVAGFSKAKEQLDELCGVADFTIHDFRRACRTGLAKLGVIDTVAEMVIGHGAKGITRVYNQHRYLDEMRAALELWAAHVLDLTAPKAVGKRHA